MERVDTNRDGAVDVLERRTEEFHRRFLLRATAGISLAATAALLVLAVVGPEAEIMACAAFVAVCCGAGFFLAWTDRRANAAQALLGGLALCGVAGTYWFADSTMVIGPTLATLIAVMLGPFLLTDRAVVVLVTLTSIGAVAAYAGAIGVRGVPLEIAGSSMVMAPLPLLLVAFVVRSFVGHARENQLLLSQRLRDIDEVVVSARKIADGDLSGDVDGDGDVQDVIRLMLRGLRDLVQQIQRGTHRMTAASSEIAAMAEQQEQSTVEQSAAIEETGRTISSLLQASGEIALAAKSVADNAEATHKNAEAISERLGELSKETERISEILEMIREVATKSEFLALNAALEGAKAGDAGRGFSLVAAQMQRLAESVMDSINGVKELTRTIQEATRTTVLATEDATKLAADTTEAAKRISAVTRQQQSSTEQVTQAMDDIAQTTQQITAGTSQSLQAVRELSQIADGLNEGALRFRL